MEFAEWPTELPWRKFRDFFLKCEFNEEKEHRLVLTIFKQGLMKLADMIFASPALP